jgi:hypothetical protein
MAAPKAGRKPSTTSSSDERIARLEEDVASLRLFVSHLYSSYEKERRYVDARFIAVDRWLTQLLNPPSRAQFKKETRAIKRDTSKATQKSKEVRADEQAQLYDYIAERINALRKTDKHLSDAKVRAKLADKNELWLEGHKRLGDERLKQIMRDLYKAGLIPHAARRTPKKKR